LGIREAQLAKHIPALKKKTLTAIRVALICSFDAGLALINWSILIDRYLNAEDKTNFMGILNLLAAFMFDGCHFARMDKTFASESVLKNKCYSPNSLPLA
jgi:hypothetical protein